MGYLKLVSAMLKLTSSAYIPGLSYLKSGLLSASRRSGIKECIGSGRVERMRFANDSLISLSKVARMNAFFGCKFESSRSSSLMLLAGFYHTHTLLDIPFSPPPSELKVAKMVREPVEKSIAQLKIHHGQILINRTDSPSK